MPCKCSEIGKDGTLIHSGELHALTVHTTSAMMENHIFEACDNHIDNYKNTPFALTYGIKEIPRNERLTLFMRMTEGEKASALSFLFGLYCLNTENPDMRFAIAFDSAVEFACPQFRFKRPTKKQTLTESGEADESLI